MNVAKIFTALTMVVCPAFLSAQGNADVWIRDSVGAVIRGDLAHKQLAIVFAGDSITSDVEKIHDILKANDVEASFFLTGRFFKTPSNKNVIQKLIASGHYFGAHSDGNLQYVHPQYPDSVVLTFEQFRHDLHDNIKHMASFGIKKEDARYFLTPSHMYNRTVVKWARALNFQLVSGSPGTVANLTFGSDSETVSQQVHQSISSHEISDRHGLNGFILLFDIASSKGNHESFYRHLDSVIKELDHRGYDFVSINTLLD